MSNRDCFFQSGSRPSKIVWRGILAWVFMTGVAMAVDQPSLKSLGVDPETNTAAVVIVGQSTLAHTTQLFPIGPKGVLAATAPEQTTALFNALQEVLQTVDSSFGRIARLNIYVANESVIPVVQAEIKNRWSKLPVKPAVTYAVTPLPRTGVLVALDAVAASASQVNRVIHRRIVGIGEEGMPQASHVTLMPPGRIVYISGQSEAGKTMGEAARKTLDGLNRTLQHIGLEKIDIVQVKSFVQPMSDAAQVDAEIARFFKREKVPAFSHVEWVDKKLTIEIELIAWAPADWKPRQQAHVDVPGSAQFVYLPWLKPNSPNYCRLTIVDQARALYFGGLYARKADTPESEVRDIFQQLKDLLKEAGSDFDHLAKATYYPSSEATSTKLNTIRPEFYNPKRPPAASKAPLGGTSRPGRNITLDIIAVTPAK